MKRALVIAALVTGCANATLEPGQKAAAVLDNKMTVSGTFCTAAPQPTEFPVRVLFMVDVSQSMTVTNPAPATCTMMSCFTRRGQAVLDVLTSNPAGNGVEYALMTFQSSSSVLTTDANGMGGFTSDGNQIKTKLPLLNLSNGQTDYEGALSNAYQLLQSDMFKLGATERSRARYIVIFLSDGLPDPMTADSNTEPRILAKVNDIEELQTEQRLAEVRFHTAYLAGPNTPLPVQLVAKNLLDDMSRTGTGTFRTFQANEKISFFYLDFSSFIRTFALKTFIVHDVNSLPRNGLSLTDSDGDGLLDEEELIYGTNPRSIDTDGDGFNDLLEVRLRDAGFNPLYPYDADCSLPQDRLDGDGDGLLNCEERFIGTDQQVMDSDADGMPDDVEFHLGTNPVVNDALDDPDFDGARNLLEVPAHTDPQRNDVAEFSQIAYRYQVAQRVDDPAHPGQQCFDFEVSNISLTATLDAQGLPSGTNTILLRVSSAPLDALDDPGDQLIACVRPRYRSDPEIKEPPSGRMTVGVDSFKKPAASDAPFVATTPSTDMMLPDMMMPDLMMPVADPTVFNAARDCISP